jgi:hypothetical protein
MFPFLRRLWSAEAGFFLAVWLGLMLVGRSTLLRDPGTFWHVVLGRQILTTGQFPRTDAFSFTFSGRPSIADQWLAEVVMAAIHRAAEWDGLLLATSALLAAAYAWIGGRLVRSGLHVVPAVLVLAVVLMTSSHNFHARPLVVTILFQAWVVGLLVDVEAGRAAPGRLWWLVPLCTVWSNMHGGVLGGIGTAGLAVAGWCLAWVLGQPSPVRSVRDVITLAAMTGACGLTVLASPYGLALPRAWLHTMSMPLTDLIQEHGRLSLAEPYGWSFVLLAVLYVVVLAGAAFGRGWRPSRFSRNRGLSQFSRSENGTVPFTSPTPPRLRVTWLIPLVWLLLAYQRVRNLPLFAVTAAVVLADLLPWSRVARWLAERDLFRFPSGGLDGTNRRTGFRAAILPAVLVAAVAMLQVAGVRAPLVGRDWARFDPQRWPVGLVDELQKIARQSPEGTPIFNDLDLGGFVIYHAPRLRVFIDDRCALYGGEFLQAYDYARLEDPAQLDRWRRQYGFAYALVQSGTQFDRHLKGTGQWMLIRRTPAAALYGQSRSLPETRTSK